MVVPAKSTNQPSSHPPARPPPMPPLPTLPPLSGDEPVQPWPDPPYPRTPKPSPDAAAKEGSFLAQIVGGRRVVPPWDDDLLVSDALAAGNLGLSLCCLVRAALAKLPSEVVTRVLAFVIARHLHVSPYSGPMPREKGGHRRYFTFEELWAFRKPGTRVLGVPDHNTTFPVVMPYPLYDGDQVTCHGAGQHRFGVGLVAEGATSYGIRFNPHAFAYYQGLSLIHGKDPERQVRGCAAVDAFMRSNIRGSVSLSLHVDPGTKRRYVRLHNARDGTLTAESGATFWLPEVFQTPVPATGHLPRVFAAFMVWNNGWAEIGGPIKRVPPSQVPPPPPTDRIFT